MAFVFRVVVFKCFELFVVEVEVRVLEALEYTVVDAIVRTSWGASHPGDKVGAPSYGAM